MLITVGVMLQNGNETLNNIYHYCQINVFHYWTVRIRESMIFIRKGKVKISGVPGSGPSTTGGGVKFFLSLKRKAKRFLSKKGGEDFFQKI